MNPSISRFNLPSSYLTFPSSRSLYPVDSNVHIHFKVKTSVGKKVFGPVDKGQCGPDRNSTADRMGEVSRLSSQVSVGPLYLSTCSPLSSNLRSIRTNCSNKGVKRFRWSRGCVLASSTQVRGFKPGRSLRISQGEKIPSTPSFGGEVKQVVPCRRFAACKFHLPRRVERGDIWRQQWELLENRVHNKPNAT
jgi:hypothetical protein